MATRDGQDHSPDDELDTPDESRWLDGMCPMEKVFAGVVLVVAMLAVMAAAWDFSGL
jgi:hypothetical protein